MYGEHAWEEILDEARSLALEIQALIEEMSDDTRASEHHVVHHPDGCDHGCTQCAVIALLIYLHEAPGTVDIHLFTDDECAHALLAYCEATSQYPEEGAPIELPLRREQLYTDVTLVHMED